MTVVALLPLFYKTVALNQNIIMAIATPMVKRDGLLIMAGHYSILMVQQWILVHFRLVTLLFLVVHFMPLNTLIYLLVQLKV